MDEFLDEMDDEQVDDLLQPEEGEVRLLNCMNTSASWPIAGSRCCVWINSW